MAIFNDHPSKDELVKRKQADLNRFLNRDSQGKFSTGNVGGPGRPKGAIGKYSQIKRDILDIWDEENGKERLRYFFTQIETFERALAIILAVCPKKSFELIKDLESGQSAHTMEERSD